MPKLGEIKNTFEVGFRGRYQVVWEACPTCKKERWVQLTRRGRQCRNHKASNASGKHFAGRGYLEVKLQPDDFFYPMVSNGDWVLEHRLVMAKHLGRCLQSWEIVHHKDGVKTNNIIENLSLVTDAGHKQITHFEKVLKKQQSEIEALQDRVTILEAENILLKSALDIEPTKSMS